MYLPLYVNKDYEVIYVKFIYDFKWDGICDKHVTSYGCRKNDITLQYFYTARVLYGLLSYLKLVKYWHKFELDKTKLDDFSFMQLPIQN